MSFLGAEDVIGTEFADTINISASAGAWKVNGGAGEEAGLWRGIEPFFIMGYKHQEQALCH